MVKSFQQIALSKGKFLVSDEIAEAVNVLSRDELFKNFDFDSPTSSAIEFQGELMRYGKILDERAFKAITLFSEQERNQTAFEMLDYLQEMFGDSQDYKTLFGDFPNTVLEMPEYVMFLHTIVHYLSDGKYSPEIDIVDDAEKKRVQHKFDESVFKSDYQKIQMITKKELCEICKTICSAEQSLNQYDKEVVEFFCKNYKDLTHDYRNCFPEKISFKETLCIVSFNVPEYKLETVTDVLRLAVYISGGDVSLPTIPKKSNYGWCVKRPDLSSYNFRKFNRAERKYLLQKIEDIFVSTKNKDNVLVEMKTRLNKWIRLAEILHPGEYKSKYPETFDAFLKLRNSAKYIETFNKKVDNCREKKDLQSLLYLLSTRPGEFARNLDWVLRKNIKNVDIVLDAFNKVLPDVSMKLLYELIDHFAERNNKINSRIVYIKGSRKPVTIKRSIAIDDSIIEQVLLLLKNALINKFKEKESLSKKIYILDENLANITLPRNMRSMNNTDGLLPRGSRIPIKTTTGKIRLYCRWFDEHGHYDLDLSAVLYKDTPTQKHNISWNTNYFLYIPDSDGNNQRACNFSGDVRHRQGACAEYIDLDLELLKTSGYKYIVACVNDFDAGGFDVKDVYGGVMEIDKVSETNCLTWAPENVTTGFKLTNKCTNVIMTVIDIENNCMYVVDEDRTGIPVSSYDNSCFELIQRYVLPNKKLTVLDVIAMNTHSRGAIVSWMDHGKLLEKKQEKERVLEKYTKELNVYIVQSVRSVELEIEQKRLESAIENLNNIVFVTYDDIAASYTNSFEWMF